MIYINGVNGKIGRYLYEFFSQKGDVQRVTSTPNRHGDIYCNLANPDVSFCHKLKEEDFFLFFAAMAVSKIAYEAPALTRKINVEGTSKVIRAILDQGSRVIFCSTTCVYGVGGKEPYEEYGELLTDKTYSQYKIEIERIFSEYENFKIVRPSNVISGNVSFINYLRYCANANKTATVYSGWHFNPIAVQDVAAITYEMVQRWGEAPKIMNLCGSKFISKEEIAAIFKEFVDKKLTYIVVPPPEEYLNEVDFYNPCSTKILASFYKKPLMDMRSAIIAEQDLAR